MCILLIKTNQFAFIPPLFSYPQPYQDQEKPGGKSKRQRLRHRDNTKSKSNESVDYMMEKIANEISERIESRDKKLPKDRNGKVRRGINARDFRPGAPYLMARPGSSIHPTEEIDKGLSIPTDASLMDNEPDGSMPVTSWQVTEDYNDSGDDRRKGGGDGDEWGNDDDGNVDGAYDDVTVPRLVTERVKQLVRIFYVSSSFPYSYLT